VQLENALLQGDPDSNTVQLKLCDFGYSKDELVRLETSGTSAHRQTTASMSSCHSIATASSASMPAD
jgi:hypothetical protein